MLPAGIQLVTVTMGPALDYQGNPLGGTVTFTPSTAVVWGATGAPIFPKPIVVTLDDTGQGSVQLPATDQAGFVDGAGHTIKDWTYRTVWSLADSGIPQPAPFSVALPAASTTVDLDLLIPVAGAGGVTVALPAVTSVNGMTGAVTIATSGGVSSVAGKTGAVTLAKADVGLGNVDNTSDAAKPISTAAAAALALKADLVGGVVPTSQLPAIALGTAVTVASQAAMLALTAAQVQPGDLAVRTDGAGTFILTAADPSVLGNWTKLNAPTDAVTTVNGQSGTVVLSAANVGAVPTTRTVAGKALSADVTIGFADLAPGVSSYAQAPAGATFRIFKDATTGFWPSGWNADNSPIYTGGAANAGVRPSARGDIYFDWIGEDPSPASVASGTGGMRDGDGRSVVYP